MRACAPTLLCTVCGRYNLKNTEALARLVAKLTGKETKAHEEAHVKLLQIARNAAAKTRKKNSVVSVAPEIDPEDQAAPPIPAGRKSLRVVN